jgi:L-lysine exporter family protein LysE/ArgO
VVEARRGVVGRAVALTWLNPHVYLDTVLLLGSIAGTHGTPGRWWFALGACVASVVWFAGLGYGARLAAPRLASPRAWQVLDVLVGPVMLAIAVRLALGS